MPGMRMTQLHPTIGARNGHSTWVRAAGTRDGEGASERAVAQTEGGATEQGPDGWSENRARPSGVAPRAEGVSIRPGPALISRDLRSGSRGDGDTDEHRGPPADALPPDLEAQHRIAAVGSTTRLRAGEIARSILTDPDLLFHGIQQNPLRVPGILKHGILSEEAARTRRVPLPLSNNGARFNGTGGVSVVASPATVPLSHQWAYRNYVRDAISFVSRGSRAVSLEERISEDERVVWDRILLECCMSDLAMFKHLASTDAIAPATELFLQQLEDESGAFREDLGPIRELISKLKKDPYGPNSEETAKEIDRQLAVLAESVYARKLGVSKPTLRDVLSSYLPEDFPVFDSDGMRMEVLDWRRQSDPAPRLHEAPSG